MDFYVAERNAYWKVYGRDGRKVYQAAVVGRGSDRMRLLRKRFRRAQEAVEYGKALMARYERLYAATDLAALVETGESILTTNDTNHTNKNSEEVV